MNKLKTSCVALVLVGTMVIPAAFVFAQTNQSASDLISQLQSQIQALQVKIQELKAAQTAAKTALGEVKDTLKLIRQLRQGMSGDDVKLLQAVLAADGTVYPEGFITGYFGRLTADAVKRFQKKHGLGQAGNVGPKTLEKLNKNLDEHPLGEEDDDDDEDEDNNNDNKGKRPCAIVPPGHLIAPGWLRKHDGERPIVPPCQKLPPGIEKKLPPSATTTPDMTAPSITSVSATGITLAGVTITWTTNESAKSKVYYGVASPLNLASAASVSDATLVTAHSSALSGLSASTTYYFVVESQDASGNIATSSEHSFVTLPVPPDTTAPVISSVTSSGIGSTIATVGWTTNESATSKVYYGTVTPLVLGSASSISDASLVTSHSLNLIGLSASTTYYYVAESKDAANNTALSSEQSFVTLP
ncbi:MAG: fibronectin type III domain-containing protein [bacterium]|nr:fibronectin type III domain-containing protein [bacterium]